MNKKIISMPVNRQETVIDKNDQIERREYENIISLPNKYEKYTLSCDVLINLALCTKQIVTGEKRLLNSELYAYLDKLCEMSERNHIELVPDKTLSNPCEMILFFTDAQIAWKIAVDEEKESEFVWAKEPADIDERQIEYLCRLSDSLMEIVCSDELKTVFVKRK